MTTFCIQKSWFELLEKELKLPYIEGIKQQIKRDLEAGFKVYPPENDIFRAFRETPFEKVKAVLVGQDPYHGPGQAEGLCFSVPLGVCPPPSLKNIHKELQRDLGITPPNHGSLLPWAKEGVLLLNSFLTVKEGQPGSHSKIGWERFTDAVLSHLFERAEPCVFLLWGAFAISKCERLLRFPEKLPHLILKAAHPSPFSVTGFRGCAHFSKANEFLVAKGKTPINWAL